MDVFPPHYKESFLSNALSPFQIKYKVTFIKRYMCDEGRLVQLLPLLTLNLSNQADCKHLDLLVPKWPEMPF